MSAPHPCQIQGPKSEAVGPGLCGEGPRAGNLLSQEMVAFFLPSLLSPHPIQRPQWEEVTLLISQRLLKVKCLGLHRDCPLSPDVCDGPIDPAATAPPHTCPHVNEWQAHVGPPPIQGTHNAGTQSVTPTSQTSQAPQSVTQTTHTKQAPSSTDPHAETQYSPTVAQT